MAWGNRRGPACSENGILGYMNEAIASENLRTQLAAANERIEALTAALHKIKVLVCGDARPNWDKGLMTTATRYRIADICDLADTAVAEENENARG